MPLSDYQTLIAALHRDDTAQITSADRDEAIARAVDRYSKDRPRLKVQDVVAAASQLIALPAGWETDFSELRAIEYPVGTIPPDMLDQARYGLQLQTDGSDKIALLDGVNIGDTLRVTYTVKHVLDVSQDTIPRRDREPVCLWAASLLLDQLASLYAGDSNSTIQADSVDHGSKAGNYRRQAAEYRKRYFDELGLDPKKAVPAGVQVNLDLPDSRGQDRLTHPRRYR